MSNGLYRMSSGSFGFGSEWYGVARFTHPSPASPSLLRTLFQSYNTDYNPSIIPSSSGEGLPALHDRCGYALSHIISNADIEDALSSEGRENETSILICTHAAAMIAIGRTLTGCMPDDACMEDFKTYTYVCFKIYTYEGTPTSDPPKMWYLQICPQDCAF